MCQTQRVTFLDLSRHFFSAATVVPQFFCDSAPYIFALCAKSIFLCIGDQSAPYCGSKFKSGWHHLAPIRIIFENQARSALRRYEFTDKIFYFALLAKRHFCCFAPMARWQAEARVKVNQQAVSIHYILRLFSSWHYFFNHLVPVPTF